MQRTKATRTYIRIRVVTLTSSTPSADTEWSTQGTPVTSHVTHFTRVPQPRVHVRRGCHEKQQKSINRTMTGPRCRRPSGTTEMPWLSKGWQGWRVPVRETSVHNSEHSVTHMRAHINDKAANGIAIDAMYTRALGPCSSSGDMTAHMTTHPHTHALTSSLQTCAYACAHTPETWHWNEPIWLVDDGTCEKLTLWNVWTESGEGHDGG